MADIAELGFSIPTAPIDNAAKSMDAMGKSAEGATKATEKMNRGTEAMMKQIASLERALGLSVTATGKLTEEISKIGTTSEKSKKETEGFSVSIQRLIDKADPLAAAQKKNATQTEALNKALRDGRVSADLHAKATAILEKEMADAVSEIEKSSQATGKLSEEAKKASGNIDSMGKSGSELTAVMGKIAGVITAALSVRQIQQYADTWSDLSSRVRLAIGPQEDTADVMSRLSDIARMTYSSLESTAEGFTRNAMTLTALGKTTQQQLDFTEALNNALVVSGAKGMAFESAQQAIGKAMAEGTLRGDELNNILNNGGRIAQLLAEDLGTNVTQLRKLAADGKITGDVIYNSLIKNMEMLREEAASMPATIGDAFTLIRNAILESVGVFDQNNKLSESLAENLVKVADAIRNTDWSPYINGLTLAAKLYAAYLVAVNAYPAAAAAWVVAIRVKTAALAAFSMQAAMTRKTLLSLNTALSVVGAAFAGWSIGTYLREEFEIVEKAGIALMSGLHQAAIAVGGVFKGLGETVKFALTSPLSFVWGRIVSFLEMIQGLGASAAKALGFEGLAEVIGQDLTHLRTTTDQEYRATIQGIVDTTKAEMAGVSDVYFELFDSVGKKAKEAGSVIEESAKTTGGTVTNTITEEMSKADKAYAKFRANLELTIQSTNLMSAAYLTSAEAVEEVTIQQEIESEVLKQGAKHREEITRLIREQHAANKALDLSKTIADMRTQNAELKAYEAALIAGGDATEAGRKALEEYNDQREIEATLVGKTSKEIDKLLPKLREEQKIRRDQRARNKEVEELNGLVNETRTAQEKANAELERLEKLAKNAKTPEHLEAIRRKTVEVKSSMSEWGQFTERAIDSVDDAFANAWKNIDQGFSSFADGLKNAFKNLLAEMAHMAITRPIIMQFASMMGIGGLVGGGSSGGGGGGGGGLLGNVSTAYSLYQGAQGEGLLGSVWKGFQGAGLNGAWSGATSYYGNMLAGLDQAAGQLWGTAVNGSSMTYAPLSYQAGQSGAGSAMGALATYAPYILAAWNGYQQHGVKGAAVQGGLAYAGGTAGAAVGAAAAGAASGTTFGATYGSYFGPIGTVVGAVLGTLLGGAILGGGDNYKRQVGSAQGSYVGGEYTGLGAVESMYSGSKRFGDDFDRSLHDLNEAFSSSLGGLFEMFGIDSGIMTTAEARLRRTSGKLAATFAASFDDQTITLMEQYGKKGRIEQSMQAWFDDVMGRGLSQAIGASQLPAYLKELTSGLATAAEVSEAVGGLFQRFDGVNSTIEALNFSAFELTDAGLRGADALLDLSAAIAGLEDPTTADKIASLTSLTGTYYDAFFSEAEKIEDTIDSITRAFEAADVELVSSREAYRAMVEDIDLTTEAGREMFATLMALSGQAATYYNTMEQQAAAANAALIGSVNTAYASLQRSIANQQRDIQQQASGAAASISALTGISNALDAALKKLRGTSDDAVRSLRAQAVMTLNSALVQARSGQSLAGFEGLQDALDTASQIDPKLYASLVDFEREQGRTANLVAELEKVNGKQLTTEQRMLEKLDGQLSALDQQLAFAQSQLDALNGVDNSVMSVVDAINAMNSSVVAALSLMGGKAGQNATPANVGTLVESVYRSVLGRDADAGGLAYWQNDVATGAIRLDQLEEAIRNAARANGEIPAFASGGFHAGGLRLVGENGPELEVTGPSRIYNAGQTASMLSGGGDTAAAIARLQQAIERQGDALRSIAKHTMQTARRVEFLERWDYDGLPPERDVA